MKKEILGEGANIKKKFINSKNLRRGFGYLSSLGGAEGPRPLYLGLSLVYDTRENMNFFYLMTNYNYASLDRWKIC